MRRGFWWQVLVNAVALWLIAFLVPGLYFSSSLSAIIAGIMLGLVNAFIRPLFVVLSLPLNLLTLGFFTFVINGIMLHITAWLSPGFAVWGFWSGVWASMLLSFFNAIVDSIMGHRY